MTEEKKKGWLKGLASLVVEEEDPKSATDSVPPPAAVKPAPAAATNQPFAAPTPPPAPPRFGAVDDKVRQVLEKVTSKVPQPALAAFQAMAEAMKAAIPDPNVRMTATLTAIKAQGHSVDAIVANIDGCQAALDAAAQANKARVDQEIQTRVGALEQSIADADTGIKARGEQIAALTREIAELQAAQGQARGQVTTERSVIEQTNASFMATYQAYRAEFDALKNTLTPRKGS